MEQRRRWGKNVGLLKPGQRQGAPKKNQEGGSSWGGTLLPSAMDREGARLPARWLLRREEEEAGRLWRLEFFEGWECKTAKGKGEGSVFIEKP
jgi:hypothetical protein